MMGDLMPYRTGLRVLGRLLDSDRARMVTLCEIEPGFLLHYFQGGAPHMVASRAIHTAEVMDLDDLLRRQRGGGFVGSLTGMLRLQQRNARAFQKTHPLCPMGYEMAFRALGSVLDHRGARSVVLTELDKHLLLEYMVDRADFVIREGQRCARAGRRQESYTAAQLAELVQSHNDNAVEQVRRSGSELEHNPLDIGAYLRAAVVLEDDGHYSEAEDLFRRALEVSDKNPEIRYHLARHAWRRGDLKAGLKHLDAAIAHRADDGRLFHLQARLLIERNRLHDAAQALQHAVHCEPGNPVFLYRLDRVHETLGVRPEVEAGSQAAVGTPARPSSLSAPISGEAAALDVGVTEHTDPSRPDDSSSPGDMGALDVYDAPRPIPSTIEPGAPGEPSPFSFDHLVARGKLVEPSSLSIPRRVVDHSDERSDLPPASHHDRLVIRALPPHVTLPDTAGDDAPPQRLPNTHDGRVGESVDALPAAWVPAESTAARVEDEVASDVPVSPPARTSIDGIGEARYAGLIATAEPIRIDGPEDLLGLATAIKRAEELVRAEPHRADLHRKLGFLLAKQGRSEEAAGAFRRAVACGRRRIAS